MKAFLFALLFLTATAKADDLKISVCPKNNALLYVEISGDSAMQIYTYTAKRLGLSTAELGEAITNNMFCRPTSVSASLEPNAVVCSYIMNGKVDVPYPQIDGGFSGAEQLSCF
jgi:hypothetical protein